ncbi:hypothetical protein D1007_34417 [Hordeum vulgare]|nr:hypothetical protein D1007_34417 [Hordeum vulgare]
MTERQVSLGEESLASRVAELQERVEKRVAEARRSLLLDNRAKLMLQESCFLECHGHLKNEVKGAASLVEEASEEAVRACSLQLECSRMFQSLKSRVSRALSDICGESVSNPLVPNDAGYLGFFLRIVERIEAAATKALALAEENSRDLLSQATSDVFSHLLCLDPEFDFAAVLDRVPETTRAALAEWVKIHVGDLVARLAPEGHGVDSRDDASS